MKCKCGKEVLYKGMCKSCYFKDYYHNPVNKKRIKKQVKKYQTRPEIRAKQNEYNQKYRKLPERAAKIKAYLHRPDVIERKREYERKYYYYQKRMRENERH